MTKRVEAYDAGTGSGKTALMSAAAARNSEKNQRRRGDDASDVTGR